jgi:hypothetical protein
VQVKIGVRNAPRELVIEVESTPDEVSKAVAAALAAGPVLELVDDKGRRVIVPTEAIAYVETGATETRSIGFGTVGA